MTLAVPASSSMLHHTVLWPGLEPGLLGSSPFTPQDLATHISEGGNPGASGGDSGVEQLLSVLGAGRLLGRGGAAFPTMLKVRAVAEGSVTTGIRPVVIANGAEGEPLSVKDRYLMRFRPHMVLDGLLAVSAALHASAVYVYAADEAARSVMGAAIAELRQSPEKPLIQVFQAQETYVAGEESAVVRAVERGIARPTDKPPRPFQVGVGGAPTLVLNVETLACIAEALRTTSESFLATVSGGARAPRLYELPVGALLGDLMQTHFGDSDSSRNMLIGGFFGGAMPAWPDLRLSHQSVQRRGGSLGCGSLHFLDATVCPIKIAADVADYFALNNARQCGMCIASSNAIAAALAELGEPAPYRKNYAGLFPRWANQLRGRGACAIPDAVAILIRSILRFYPEVLARHFAHGCGQCATAASKSAPRWEHLSVKLPDTATRLTGMSTTAPTPVCV